MAEPQDLLSEPRPFAAAKLTGYAPSDGERIHAQYAHWFGAASAMVCCMALVPIAAPFIAYFMTKERGPFVAFHAHQAAAFQAAMFVLVALTFPIFWGLGLAFLYVVPWLIAIALPIVIAAAARSGEWKEYPVIGGRVLELTRAIVR